MDLTEKIIKQYYAYQGKIINVRKDRVILPNGKESIREVVEHTGGVAVLPLTKDNEAVMVRQYRYAFLKELLEVPAGKMDKGEEDPYACGTRELLEETGLTAKKMIYLGCIYPSVGFLTEIIHLYLATGLEKGKQNLDEDEFLDVVTIPFDSLIEKIMRNEITDAKTIAAALKTKELMRTGQI